MCIKFNRGKYVIGQKQSMLKQTQPPYWLTITYFM